MQEKQDNTTLEKTDKNSLVLKIEKTEKEKLEKELKNTNTLKVVKTITEKNKVITLNKKVLDFFNANGVKLGKVYYSYNSNPNLYNILETIIDNNKDIFTIISK